jgi:ABC-type Fe3+/spermidine/putrescine transport system ATPase subunit
LPALTVESLSRRWPGFSLHDISFGVEAGEYFVLLGPNGSGKSLLIETILGFHNPDSGRVTLHGAEITGAAPESRGIGYVPQRQSLFPHMTVAENVGYGLRVRGAPPSAVREEALRLLRLIRLETLADKRPGSLSGGEKQRVVLARALAAGRRLVLLDEPLSGVDAESRGDLMRELKRVNRELGAAFLHVTHDVEEAFSLADRIGVLAGGRLTRVGSPGELFEDPGSGFMARMLGYDNVLDSATAARLLPELKPGEAGVALRGDLVEVLNDTVAGAVEAVVLEAVDCGLYTLVSVDAGVPLRVRVPKRPSSSPPPVSGSRVWLRVPPEAVKPLRSI